MPHTQAWLKAIGTGEDPLPDEWLQERPDLLRTVHFIKQPTGIKRRDLLVYYAAGKQRIFAIARASQPGDEARMAGPADQRHWPYQLQVQVVLAVPTLPLALPYGTLGKSPAAITQKSHIRLEDAEYQRVVDALADRVSVS